MALIAAVHALQVESYGPGAVERILAAQDAALLTVASLRDGLEALEEDTEEAFLKRRELVKLLVERITISGGEDRQVKIDPTG